MIQVVHRMLRYVTIIVDLKEIELTLTDTRDGIVFNWMSMPGHTVDKYTMHHDRT